MRPCRQRGKERVGRFFELRNFKQDPRNPQAARWPARAGPGLEIVASASDVGVALRGCDRGKSWAPALVVNSVNGAEGGSELAGISDED